MFIAMAPTMDESHPSSEAVSIPTVSNTVKESLTCGSVALKERWYINSICYIEVVLHFSVIGWRGVHFSCKWLRNLSEEEKKEHVKDLGMQFKETDDTVKKLKERMTVLQERQEEAQRYSRQWNLHLLNLPEHSNEDVRREVMGIIAQIN